MQGKFVVPTTSSNLFLSSFLFYDRPKSEWPALSTQSNRWTPKYVAKHHPSLTTVEVSKEKVLMFWNDRKAFARYQEIQQQKRAKDFARLSTDSFFTWATGKEGKRKQEGGSVPSKASEATRIAANEEYFYVHTRVDSLGKRLKEDVYPLEWICEGSVSYSSSSVWVACKFVVCTLH